ncbi:gamma-glutamylcyclotransferase family protein [Roseobacter sinensis]|uniref:Gamma-glutamylcyclotransferase n=1 Tax=Roseobacter sinensis TaxID=2931391 RepID=A0ABT3BD14_9RHOB|nr:gamma-glutamylcyclotransferase family protein [Roseobacter sp. WL0113]MCV3271452.1 gamma-glutamylcyclotransferase [Roseobacter sp. WL0113]
MSDPYFFGYGSLVNTRSHAYPDPHPARLRGWRRAWVTTPRSGAVLLTGVPAPGHCIEGLIAAVPGADWTALDARENGYARVSAHGDIDHAHPATPLIDVYAVERHHLRPRSDQMILLSYLDVVVQGFHDVFGEAGVQSFFDTTDGWDTPILNDRDNPIYPRHQQLTRKQTVLVDDHLHRLSAQVKERHEAPLPPEF